MPSSARNFKPGAILGAAGLLFLVCLAYWPALRGQFVWDDRVFAIDDTAMSSSNGLYEIWFGGIGRDRDFLPITNTLFWIGRRIFGLEPLGYHIVNLLIHYANALLLWLVLWSFGLPCAWLASAIFAVHPVCVASVAWISEAKNTLSMFFSLVCALFYIKAEAADRTPPPPKRAIFYGMSLLAVVLALMSKGAAVMVPVALLGIAIFRRNQPPGPQTLAKLGPFFLVSLFFGLMTMMNHSYDPTWGMEQKESLPARAAEAGWAVWFYLGKAFLPLNLAAAYPRWELTEIHPAVFAPGLLLLAVFYSIWRYRTHLGKPCLAATAYFITMLLPALGIITMKFLWISRVADHFLYHSLPAIAVLAAIPLHLSFPKKTNSTNRWRFAGASAVLLCLVVLARQHAAVYTNDLALWSDNVRRHPDSGFARCRLGDTLAGQGQLDEAVAHLNEALRLRPFDSAPNNSLGIIMYQTGKPDLAREHFERALRINPFDPMAHCNLANVLDGQGMRREAIKHYFHALRVVPDNPQMHRNLGNLLLADGSSKAGQNHIQEALRLESNQ